MNDQNKKTLRQFQCRDYLWEIFEQMSAELECSVDYLINESMRQYARSRNYGARGPTPEPATRSSAPLTGGPAIPSAPPPPGARPANAGFGATGPVGYNANSVSPSFGAPPPPQGSPGYGPPPGRSSAGGYAAPSPGAFGAPQSPSYPPTYSSAGAYGAGTPSSVPPPTYPPPGGGYPSSPAYPAPPARPPQGGASGPGFAPPPPLPTSVPPPIPRPGSTHPAEPMPPLFVIFNGQKFPVNKEEFIIGRGTKTADLAIKDGNISRRHAAIIFQNGAFYMKDLGSTNGVEFQGRRVDGRRIEEGDVYQLCDYELRFTYR